MRIALDSRMFMLSRTRKLSTVGLPLRDDLLIRSLVQVIGTKTVDDWTFHEGFEADVVLCNPDSNLSGVALRRAGESDALTCVSVVHNGQDSLPGTRVLCAPIKSVEFIALLNDISHSGSRGHRPPAQPAETSDTGNIADALHELMQAKSSDLHAIECGAATLFVVPASRTLYAMAAPTEADLQQWLRTRQMRVRRVDERSVHHIVGDVGNKHDLEGLLWGIGLVGTGDALLRGLPEGARFKLKRWPDFGRLAHETFHFRMAALLSRGAYTMEELAAASKRMAGEAGAFINACAMCDLISVHANGAAAPKLAAAPPQRRYSSILDSIRSALGLRH